MAKIKEDGRPMGSPRSWAATYGTHLTGQAAIDGADHAAITMENKWGAGRLRLLVGQDLRERFDKQRFKFNAAIWHGDLEEVRREASRMEAAWRALDGQRRRWVRPILSPEVWEVALADGTVAAIVRDLGGCSRRDREGRRVRGVHPGRNRRSCWGTTAR